MAKIKWNLPSKQVGNWVDVHHDNDRNEKNHIESKQIETIMVRIKWHLQTKQVETK